MLRAIRRAVLELQRDTGLFEVIANSEWRRSRLLILCYHGVSTRDEHLWRPDLCMHPDALRERLQILKNGNYTVLPLGEALQRLRSGDLPPRSVCITFDDGGYDFYKAAFPVIKGYGFPVTVYQTTYYGDYPKPIFNIVCSYMLWKRRGNIVSGGIGLGLSDSLDLRTEDSRAEIVRSMVIIAEEKQLTGVQKDEVAAKLADLLSLSYDEIVESRLFQIMNSSERTELAAAGVDFQLHTHRHRTPLDEMSFRKEIQDNRRSLLHLGNNAVHFCYPSGIYRREFEGWLRAEKVISATTCDVGLASRNSNLFLLPRLVDTSAQNALEFEGWISGISSFMTGRRAARQIIPAAAGKASQSNWPESAAAKGFRED